MKLRKLSYGYMRIAFGVGLFSFPTISILGSDCSFSTEFLIEKPQHLSGVFQDPMGDVLPGLEVQLLKGKVVVHKLRTNDSGGYDFGQIQPGKYRIHIRDKGHPFCAPKVTCGKEGCKLEPRLELKSKGFLVVSYKGPSF